MCDNFIFPRFFYDAIKVLPKSTQSEIYTAIMEYSFYGNEVEIESLKPTAQSVYILMRNILDNDKVITTESKQETSSRKGVGGAPKGSRNNPNGRKGTNSTEDLITNSELTRTNSELTQELTRTNSELTQELTRTNSELTQELTRTNSELTQELTRTNSELTDFKKEKETEKEPRKKSCSKERDKKENNKEKEKNPTPPYVVVGQKTDQADQKEGDAIEKEIEELKTQTIWLDQVKFRYSIFTTNEVFKYLDDFALDCHCQGKTYHNSLSDAKQHFFNWLRKKREYEQLKSNSSNHRSTAEEEKRKRDEEFAEHIRRQLAEC